MFLGRVRQGACRAPRRGDTANTEEGHESLPENARDIFARGQQEAADVLVGLPIDGGGDEEVLDCGEGGG